MGKNIIQNVVIHVPENINFHTLSDRVSDFHVDVIRRRLNQSDLTTEQKVAVIDKIILDLKSREEKGIIK